MIGTVSYTHLDVYKRQLLDYAQDDFMGLTYDDGNKAFANGEAAMIINGNWAINQYKNANKDINVDMFALPASNEMCIRDRYDYVSEIRKA